METILLLAILYHVVPDKTREALKEPFMTTEPPRAEDFKMTLTEKVTLGTCLLAAIGVFVAALWPALDSLPPIL